MVIEAMEITIWMINAFILFLKIVGSLYYFDRLCVDIKINMYPTRDNAPATIMIPQTQPKKPR